MTSIALAFASVSLLSRGVIVTRVDGFMGDSHTHTVRRVKNLGQISYRKMPMLYMAFFIISETICVVLGISTFILLNAFRTDTKIARIISIGLALQALFVVYSAVASMWLKGRRWWTFWIAVIVAVVPSIIFMVWAWRQENVGINFGDWSYGQTFNAATGIAGFLITFVDWMTSKESAVDV